MVFNLYPQIPSEARDFLDNAGRLDVLVVSRFSLRHDDECNGTKSEASYHVMAPTLDYEAKPWSWSQCSRDKITEFLEYIRLDKLAKK